jgi:hypothetical protein
MQIFYFFIYNHRSPFRAAYNIPTPSGNYSTSKFDRTKPLPVVKQNIVPSKRHLTDSEVPMHSDHPNVSLADNGSSTPAGRFTLFSRKPSSLPILMSLLLLVTAFLAQIVIAWRFQYLTWDDSDITLGFSRTFAHTGKPTPGSGIVEGYSTTLWMLLMAAAAKIASSPTVPSQLRSA